MGEVEKVVEQIAEMMGEFVENWPAHKKLKTSLALIAKTLRASRAEVKSEHAHIEQLEAQLAEARAEIGRLLSAHPYYMTPEHQTGPSGDAGR